MDIRRVLRLVILGPIFLVAALGLLLVLPFVAFVRWLYGERATFKMAAEVAREAWEELWFGAPR